MTLDTIYGQRMEYKSYATQCGGLNCASTTPDECGADLFGRKTLNTLGVPTIYEIHELSRIIDEDGNSQGDCIYG